MRVLLLGADGMLGRDLRGSVPAGMELRTVGREVDLRDVAAVERLVLTERPAWTINAAAYTRVDDAERESALAFEVNGTAVGALAEACRAVDCGLAHFSTDYVFDGLSRTPYGENDAPRPLNVYGASKLAGERAIARVGGRALVLRTQWLFGRDARSFPAKMLERALRGLPTRVVNDQWGRPTPSAELADATWRLIGSGASGLFHVASSGPAATWYDVARRVFAAVGAEAKLADCTTADYPTPAARPAFAVLDTAALAARLGAPLPDWRDSLDSYVRAALAAGGRGGSLLDAPVA